MEIKRIWWRKITANDLFNIEKPLPPGPKGQLHIDVPNVPALLQFFDSNPNKIKEDWSEFQIDVKVFQDQEVSSSLTFRPRTSNDRYDIQRQNINSDSSERHPAWTSAFGWPNIHGNIHSTSEAETFLKDTPLVIVIFKDERSDYYAAFLVAKKSSSKMPRLVTTIFSGRSAGILFDINSKDSKEFIDFLGGVSSSHLQESKNISEEDVLQSGNSVTHPKSGTGQGFGLSQVEKKAVELRAVDVAMEYFRGIGWHNVKHVGDFASYDISGTFDGQFQIAEVKGTTTAGLSIILTKNEVEVHKGYYPRNALVVVSDIELTRSPTVSASGGKLLVISPWDIDQEDLTALTFKYSVPSQV